MVGPEPVAAAVEVAAGVLEGLQTLGAGAADHTEVDLQESQYTVIARAPAVENPSAEVESQ